MMPEVLAIAYRGDMEESRHYGSVVVVDSDGNILFSRGDANRFTFLRSAAKPFQVLPLFDTGTFEHYGFTQEEIAVMCGSHSGEDMHVEKVISILDKIGLAEDSLQCGVHTPFHRPTAKRLLLSGETLSPTRNTCSGKHACMLAITQFNGHDINTYMEQTHPVQKLMLSTVAEMTQFPAQSVGIGTDTCGVPVFAVPLKNMALGYANLAKADKYSGNRRDGIFKIKQSMSKYPNLVAGTGRFTTDLLKVMGTKVIAKDGAEASFGMGILQEDIGIAVKIEDGSNRALSAVVLEVLNELNLLDNDTKQKLSKYMLRRVKTWNGETIGKIVPVKLF